MKTDQALNQAFAGCGLVLSHAKGSRRYRELLQLNRGDHGAATLDLLGEALIREAIDCLPVEDQEQVRYWHQLTGDEQFEALQNFIRRLTHPTNHAYPDDPYDAPYLPRRMGKWSDPGIQRNCLGLAILLAAYASLLGFTRYYFASVQRLAAEPVNWGLQDVFGRAIGIINQRLAHDDDANQLAGLMQAQVDDARASSELLAEREQFHGGLVLQQPDGRWINIDPYQDNLSYFPPERSFTKVDATLGRLRDFANAITVNGSPSWTRLPEFSAELTAIESIENERLLEQLRQWHRQVWRAAQGVATESPHYALTASYPARSLAVRVLINERERCGQPQAADLLRYSHMDTVLYHAILDSRSDRPLSGAEQRLLKERIELNLRTPSTFRHPLLNKILEETSGTTTLN